MRPLTRQTASAGLSPRVRGNPIAADEAAGIAGSIPACAGEPLSVMWCEFDFRVYPRVCGGTRL